MAGGYKPQWQWSTLGGDWSGLRAAIHSVRFPGQTAGVVSVKSRCVRSTEQVPAVCPFGVGRKNRCSASAPRR